MPWPVCVCSCLRSCWVCVKWVKSLLGWARAESASRGPRPAAPAGMLIGIVTLNCNKMERMKRKERNNKYHKNYLFPEKKSISIWTETHTHTKGWIIDKLIKYWKLDSLSLSSTLGLDVDGATGRGWPLQISPVVMALVKVQMVALSMTWTKIAAIKW